MHTTNIPKPTGVDKYQAHANKQPYTRLQKTKTTRTHPESQTDYLASTLALQNFKIIKAPAECNLDHYLLRSQIPATELYSSIQINKPKKKLSKIIR